MNMTASIYPAMCKVQTVCSKAVYVADCKAQNTPPHFCKLLLFSDLLC